MNIAAHPIIMTKSNIKNRAKKSPVLSVRLTQEERETLLDQAGEMRLSDYVRSKLFSDGSSMVSKTQTRLSVKDRQKLLAQILIKLGQMKSVKHLGDLVGAIRSGIIDADPELLDAVNKLRYELNALRTDLLRALGLRSGAKK